MTKRKVILHLKGGQSLGVECDEGTLNTLRRAFYPGVSVPPTAIEFRDECGGELLVSLASLAAITVLP